MTLGNAAKQIRNILTRNLCRPWNLCGLDCNDIDALDTACCAMAELADLRNAQHKAHPSVPGEGYVRACECPTCESRP